MQFPLDRLLQQNYLVVLNHVLQIKAPEKVSLVLEHCWLPMTHVKETMMTLKPSHIDCIFGSVVLSLGNIFPCVVNTGDNKTDSHSEYTNGTAVISEHNYFLM